MKDWPPLWEEAFDLEAGASPLSHRLATEAEVRKARPLRSMSDEQKKRLAHMIWTVDWWASEAAKGLRDCSWTDEQLRDAMPACLTAPREQKAWKRYRTLLHCVDACGATRDAILRGELLDAVEWALIAGNQSLLDLAEIGRASLGALPKKGEPKPPRPHLRERDAQIAAEARAIWARNPGLSATSVAGLIATKHKHEHKFPRAETIRRLMRQASKSGMQALPSQK